MWLLKNYKLLDTFLNIKLIINKLEMKIGDKIQIFINQFKIIIIDFT